MKKNILISFFLLFTFLTANVFANTTASTEVNNQEKPAYHSKTMSELVDSFYATTGIKALLQPQTGV